MFATSGKVSLVAALFATCSVTLARSAAIPGDRLLLMAAAAIRKQERAVRTIRFAFRESATMRMGMKTKLAVGGSSRGVATLGGMPRGKCRFDVSLDTTGPVAPFYTRAYSVAYNGRVGTYLQTMEGAPWQNPGHGKLWTVDRGNVTGKIPSDATELFADSGWVDTVFGFTSTFFRYAGYPRFSAFIAPGWKHTVISAHWVTRHGARYLAVTRISPVPHSGPKPIFKIIFYLDPLHGFAIARFEEFYPAWVPNTAGLSFVVGSQPVSLVRVKGFYQPIPGVFFPRQIRFTGYFRNGEVCQTASCRISHVVVNEPKVNTHTWVVAFPAGASVADAVTGKTIRVGGTPAQQLKEIEAAVKAAK